jgi:3-hydroxymyristoyl/3-hydroxydecanoyl-(acyl carrier protein) dehydratase
LPLQQLGFKLSPINAILYIHFRHMNFLFVDRILAMEPGKKAVALKHVTASDAYLFKTHDDKTALYSCIIGEAIGQLCSWNVIQGTNYGLRLIGGVVGAVIMHSEVLLGETVVLENTIETLDTENNVCHFHGAARVGGRLILELKDGLGPIMGVEKFGDVNIVKKEYEVLYRPGEVPVIPEGQPLEQEVQINNAHLNYDRILEWQSGEFVVAQKNISMTAPYFHDHFPHRPVLPVTLMIQSNLILANQFLSELLKPGQRLQPMQVRRVKMNDFVSPGAIITTKLQLQKREETKLVVVFRSESEGKRVCVCEAEFEVI